MVDRTIVGELSFWILNLHPSTKRLTNIIQSGQICRVEQAVTRVRGASASELVVREAECHKTEICMTGECMGGTALGN